jgi:nucleoid DNA-binding protein
VHLPPKAVPHFKPGKELRERVDNAWKGQDATSS